MAGNQQVLTAILRLSDQMTPGLVAPKKALQGLETGFQKTQQSATASLNKVEGALKPLWTTAQATLGKISKGAQEVSLSFGAMEKSSSRLLTRTANLTNRLMGIALAAHTLGGRDGGFKAAGDGLATFAGISAALPGPVGLGVGAVAGLAMAFKSLKDSEKDAADNLRNFKQQLEESRRAMYEARGQFLGGIATSKNPALTANRIGIENTKDAIGTQMGLEKAAQVAMMQNQSNPLSLAFLKAKDSAEEARFNIEKLKKTLAELQEEGERLELDDKLKELDKETEITHQKVMMNLVSPLESAETQLRLFERAIEDLIRAQDSMGSDEFEEKLNKLTERAERSKAIIKALKADEDDKREKERQALKALENSWAGLSMGVQAYIDGVKTAKDFTLQMLGATQSAMTNAFESLLSGGKRAKDALKTFLRDMKSNLIRTVSEMMSQAVMKQFMGLLGFGGGAAGQGVATQDPRSNATQTGTQTNGINMSSLGGMFGLDASTGASIAGGIAGAAIGVQGVKAGNVTQSTAGMAMAGMSIGAIAGPIGAVAGLAIGAIAGAIMGSRAKRRAKKKRRAAEAAARAAHEAAVERARVVLKQDIRNKMGGGLATEEAANEIGALFSGGLSEEEILKFGDPSAIAARASAVEQQRVVNVGGIAVTAYISGKYDVEVLSRDLGAYLESQMGGPAGGLVP